MAICKEIIVSGAGLSSTNGVYLSAGNEIIGGQTFTRYTKDGNFSSVPYICANVNPPFSTGFFYWEIYDTIPVFGTQPIYRTTGNNILLSSFPDCPSELPYATQSGPWGASTYLPAPTVTTATLSPVEERNAKYAVEGEDGESRFKRLFSLGYL